MRKQHLELDMKQQTGSKLGKEYVKVVYCHPAYLTYMQNPMDGGAWWAAVHGVARSRTRLSDFTFTSHFHALEEEMATHSRILAWRIPQTEDQVGYSP